MTMLDVLCCFWLWDIKSSRHLGIPIVQADYLLTKFSDGAPSKWQRCSVPGDAPDECNASHLTELGPMPRHYNIYKHNPRTKEKTLLHEKVPEALADWLAEQAKRELKKKVKSSGFKIVTEPSALATLQRKAS